MSPEERTLITGLFDRIRDAGAIDKDRQAETLIRDAVRQLPDAPYVLVQSVLLQENALADAQARIQELEDRVAELEAQQAPPTRSSGSFLGGANKAASPWGRGTAASVPVTGRAAQDSEPRYDPVGSRQPGYMQPPPPQAQAPAPSSSGGFFRSAMAAAAGVAGGVLLSDSIKGMMGGGHSDTHQAGSGPHYQDSAHNDPGASSTPAEPAPVEDASWDDSDSDTMDA